MMKLKNTLILLVCFLTLTFSAGAQNNSTGTPKDDKKQAAYNELLGKLKGGDTSIDFKALRMGFTETKDYSYHGLDKEELAKMMKPLGEKNYKEALKQAEKVLEKNYVDANTHYVFYTASKELKDDKNAEFHRAVLVGLLNSIKDGNDGLTAKTSFLAITIDEEYTLMKFLGYKVEGQSLQSADGHKYDVLSVVNSKTGEKAKFYFNIDKVWEAETKLFGN
jgi:hypothetical protein